MSQLSGIVGNKSLFNETHLIGMCNWECRSTLSYLVVNTVANILLSTLIRDLGG